MYDLSYYNLGETIKNIRKNKGITLEEFGDKIGKTKSTMYKYESGDIIPDFITIIEMCNVLNININQLCNFENFEQDNTKLLNPFKTEKLYLYYIGFEGKLVISIIDIENMNGLQKAYFHNTIKNKSNDCAFEYIGSLESDNIVAYINLRNDGNSNTKFEKVQIIVNLRYASNNKYMGCICGTTDSNIPTIRKCLITPEILTDRDELNKCFEDLQITDKEIEDIKKENFWNIKTNNFQEYSVEVLNK